MTVINSFSPARQQNTVAFKSNDQQEFYPGYATASLILPGIGQLAKGETQNGLARLGVYVATIGTGAALAMGKIKNSTVASVLGVVALSAFVINHINSAFDAFKPKKLDIPDNTDSVVDTFKSKKSDVVDNIDSAFDMFKQKLEKA